MEIIAKYSDHKGAYDWCWQDSDEDDPIDVLEESDDQIRWIFYVGSIHPRSGLRFVDIAAVMAEHSRIDSDAILATMPYENNTSLLVIRKGTKEEIKEYGDRILLEEINRLHDNQERDASKADESKRAYDDIVKGVVL